MEALIKKREKLEAKLKALDLQIETEQKQSIYCRGVYPWSAYDENRSLYFRYPPDQQINEFLDELAGSEEICPHDGPDSVKSKEDQLKILRDMRDSKFPIWHNAPILGMFHHADDVRFIYERHGFDLPDWYRAKYGEHFAKQ